MHHIVRAAGPTTFSTVTYLIPVVSTALGVLILSEPLGWNEPAGAAVVLGVMWWSSRPRDQREATTTNQRPSRRTSPASPPSPRSEERRVGEECRSRWSPYYQKNKP